MIDGTPRDINRSEIMQNPEKKDRAGTSINLAGNRNSNKLKLPFSHDMSDISRGLKVNSNIIKICRLDFNRQRELFLQSLRELLILGRGDKRVDFR